MNVSRICTFSTSHVEGFSKIIKVTHNRITKFDFALVLKPKFVSTQK